MVSQARIMSFLCKLYLALPVEGKVAWGLHSGHTIHELPGPRDRTEEGVTQHHGWDRKHTAGPQKHSNPAKLKPNLIKPISSS